MMKIKKTVVHAAIYLRVSTEMQADKISPHTQEADCKAYCEMRGYTVSAVYRDTEKYRVGKRMVEPSGTRNDRPGLRRMIADADAGQLDVIVAWREDRLYRATRPMLDVIDCIERNGIDIELVKETFDRKIAPVKAWAARMELDAKHDRMLMGVAGRLSKGKGWNGHRPYGYAYDDGRYIIHPEESKWVSNIWQWYADGIRPKQMRAKLVEGNAPQRRATRVAWALPVIRTFAQTGVEPLGGLHIVTSIG